MKNTLLKTTTLTAAVLTLGLIFVPSTEAGGWSISIGGSPWGYNSYGTDYYYGGGCCDVYQGDWYPHYTPRYRRHHRRWNNPVVDRRVDEDGHYHRDGTHHGESTVVDRHASYYSPGRNQAITRPRTTTSYHNGPGYERERERTRWIGADGRPHSTTTDRVTTHDRYGNQHTDTHVTLKNKKQPKGGVATRPVPPRQDSAAPAKPYKAGKVKGGSAKTGSFGGGTPGNSR